MYCTDCGIELPDNSNFCSSCGFKTNTKKENKVVTQKKVEIVELQKPTPSKKNKVILAKEFNTNLKLFLISLAVSVATYFGLYMKYSIDIADNLEGTESIQSFYNPIIGEEQTIVDGDTILTPIFNPQPRSVILKGEITKGYRTGMDYEALMRSNAEELLYNYSLLTFFAVLAFLIGGRYLMMGFNWVSINKEE
jgi:hypothetical protein